MKDEHGHQTAEISPLEPSHDGTNAERLRSMQLVSSLGALAEYDESQLFLEARFFAGAAHESLLQLGYRLVALKEKTTHGAFGKQIAALGLQPRAAQRAMSTALRVAKFPALANIAENSPYKALEMFALDDDILEVLADGGTIAGVTLDAIDRMSGGEARKALRAVSAEKAEQAETTTRLIASKNQKLDELDSQLAKSRSIKPSDQRQMAQANEAAALAELAKQATALTVQLLQYCQYAENCADVEGLDLLGAETIKQNARSSVEWVCHRLHQTVCSFGLEINVQAIITPPWLNQASAPSASA